MSNGKCIDKNPLQRNGLSQQERMAAALPPESLSLHDFTEQDWLRYAYHFAKELNYFNTDFPEIPQGNWQDFFVAEEQIKAFVQSIESGQNTEPHLALFVAFLKLIAYSQTQLNGITKRHLDFYYQEVLQFNKQEFTPDHVFVVFELAKNVFQHHLEKGSLLDAGKDSTKRNLQYAVPNSLVLNRAVAEQFKTIYHQQGKSFRYADMAPSTDGIGHPLDPDNPSWFAFGQDGSVPGFATLPVLKTGFALASGVLAMAEGKRIITLNLSLQVPADFDTTAFNDLSTHTTALVTGTANWIPLVIQKASVTKSGSSAQLSFELSLSEKDDAIVAYDVALHAEHYTTELPVIRLLWAALSGEGYEVYRELSTARLTKADIDVSVSGLKSFQAENDQGVVDASKPFLPFGTQARTGANFYIGSTEIFSKKWKNISLNIEWKDLPDDLSDHYVAYQKRFLNAELTRQKYTLTATSGDSNREVTGDNYFNVAISFVKDGVWQTPAINRELFVDQPIALSSTPEPSFSLYFPGVLYQTGINKNKSVIQQYFQEHYAPVFQPYVPVYNIFTFNPGFVLFHQQNQAFGGNVKDNFLRIRLIQDFLHQHFARLYALAMSVEGGDALIPQAPYTPTIASLSIDYSASVSNDFQFSGTNNTAAYKLSDYRNRNIQLFHESAFGQAQQHVFLKEQLYPAAVAGRIALLPQYPQEAAFYLGLKQAPSGSQVSVLFQLAEGSENPLSNSFSTERKIGWSALGNNEWKPLSASAIVADTTNNFLKSGIITFQLPPHSTEHNTVMPEAYHWLKAELPATCSFDAVCRFIGVHTQAVEAQFQNNGNELNHLKTTLSPGSIKKLSARPAAVKKVTQIGNSFGGSGKESDRNFYTRVSERLRHKNRAITISDYEHLVLQAFPGIHRVKCLNHTSAHTTAAPGHEIDPGCVCLTAIPDVSNRHLYDVLQPRVSSNVLREIEQYLAKHYSMHIRFAAEHPQYEAVQFSFQVRFHPQFEQNAYREILNQTLIKYLAPWIQGGAQQLYFGTRLYKTVVISFIETLEYVDYLSDFKMFNMEGKDQSMIVASSSRSILTSAKHHLITIIAEEACTTEI